MDDLTGKVDFSTDLPAAEWNQLPQEVQNMITSNGQGLTNGDLQQLAKSITNIVANGNFYADGGVADAYVLSPVLVSKVKVPNYVDGQLLYFIVGNSNAGASTVDVEVNGVVELVDNSGSALTGGELLAGDLVQCVYNLGSNHFRLVLANASLSNVGIVSLNSSTVSASETEAATPLAVSLVATAAAESLFPGGTMMIFGTIPPPGWTQFNPLTGTWALRITTGDPGTIGGAINFSNTFSNTILTDGTSLSTNQIPAHSHALNLRLGQGTGTNDPAGGLGNSFGGSTANSGGGEPHDHAIASMNLKFVDFVQAIKD